MLPCVWCPDPALTCVSRVQEPVFVRGSMLAGWGSALPGVGRSARAHVHEYGIHALRDGDGWWPSEAERRGPWFWEVTPADHEKLREINVDSNGPLDELPLEELGEAIDDPFDDAPAAEQEEPVVERAGPAEEESW